MTSERSFPAKATPLYPALVIMGLLTTLVTQGQTATNACTPTAGNEYSVTQGATCSWQTFNKAAAFTNAYEPNTCLSQNGATSYGDGWGWFTAVNTTTTITFDPASSHRPILHVFTGTCGGTLTQVACQNSGGNGTNAVVTFTSVIGQVYLIRVQRHQSNAVMNGTICILSPKGTNACALEASNQFNVNSTCTFQPFNKPAAYTATFNPGTCGAGNFNDSWGWFTATSSQTVLTYDPDGSERPILHVFSGACGSLTQVGCVDAGANSANAELVINTTIGQNYIVRIQRQGANTVMNGRLCVWSPSSTNTCAFDAQNQFTPTATCTFQPFHKPEAYTSSMNPGGCGSSAADDAWGWFTATSTSTVITFDPDPNVRPILHVFSGTCGSLAQVGCHDSGANGANATVTIPTTIGQSYAFRVQRQGSNVAMDGRICIWDPSTGTTTNTCAFGTANAYAVNSSCVFQPFNKPASYTASMNPGGCNSGNFTDAWGWFTATDVTTIITFDPDNNHRPILHVFTGTCGSLTQIGCHDAGGNGANANVLLNTTPGQDYAFRVQRQGTNDAMNGRICIRIPPSNDDCATPIALPVLENCFMQTFTNDEATLSSQTPNPSCGGTFNVNTGRDVWFTFTTPSSGQVIIETAAGTLTAAAMQLYSGTCGSLSAIACTTTGGAGNMPRIDRMCNPLTPGATYRIRLWGTGGGRGTFSLCVYGPENFTPRSEDCVGSIPVCSDQSINNNASSFGCTQDLNNGNRGCLNSNERQGSWYTFSPSASGTLEFTITPNGNVDYDFAIWGPLTAFACPPAGTPVRCSYASPTNSGGNTGAGTYLTGLKAGNTDTSEPAYNGQVNGFVAPLQVLVGEYYILYIDNFTSNGQSFGLDWTLTNGASLDCNVLPVELIAFGAEAARDHVALEWTTLTEVASSHFVVERSSDGSYFVPIGSLPAAGSSLQRTTYQWHDTDPLGGLGYYRLRQVDLDGNTKYSEVVSAVFRKGSGNLTLYPNPARDRITMELPGTHSMGSVTIVLMDASGRILGSSIHPLDDGRSTIGLSIQHLEPGSYLVRAIPSNGQEYAIGRFVKE